MTEQRRLRISKIGDQWLIWCDVCEPSGWLPFPWVTCKTFRAAVVLADWHRERHRTEKCDCCGSMPSIDKPVAKEAPKGMFKVGDDVYQLTDDAVIRLKVVPA